MNMEIDVAERLRALKAKAAPELHDYFAKFEDLHDRKLWHQLTVAVMQFMILPAAKPLLIPLYEHFISAWEKKIKKTSFVQIMLITAKQYPDPKNGMAFIDKITSKVEDEKDAFILACMELAHYKLVLGDMEGTRAIMDKCEPILEGLSGTEPIIHAGYYRVCAEYYKAKADYSQYYRNALLFLACINANDLGKAEKVARAYDLALSALLGDSIFNFGELLMHPILESLKGTEHEWLYVLLHCLNSGEIGKFDVLATNFTKQPLLAQSVNFLRQKLCLMSLIELIFKRPGNKKRIPFQVITKETKLPVEEIEHLIMKALAIGLIKGKIDQVDNSLEVDWVQPRVLDRTQIETMRLRIVEWAAKVDALCSDLKNEAPDLMLSV